VAGICNSVVGGVFLTCHCGDSAGGSGKYGSSVKARVVNWKQVDFAVEDHSGCPGMC